MMYPPRALISSAPERIARNVSSFGASTMHGVPALDQRDDAVLELAAGEALGVDVAHLFDLERGLERHRIARAAADHVQVLGCRRCDRASVADLLDASVASGTTGSRRRPARAARGPASSRPRAAYAAISSTPSLAVKLLVASTHRSGPADEQDRVVDQAVQARALDVDQRRQLRAALLGRLHRVQQVDRLAALAEADDQAALVEEVGQVAELRADDAVCLATGDARKEVLAAARGVRRGAAADEVDGARGMIASASRCASSARSAARRRSTGGCSWISLAM